jgi:hypothetical protein
MATSISELKKRKNKRFEDLKDKLENNNSSKSYKNNDERFWYPDVDKSGNGFAIIRFLDSPKGEDDPYIKLFSHSFQGPNGWFIENCPTSINKSCTLCDYNRRLWNSGIESDKNIVRNQKRKLTYISNILVIKDPQNPENEGTVRLFKFGQKVFAKIQDQMKPEFEDEEPTNIFDFWEGSNFRLKIRQVDGYRNYDKSEFDSPSAIYEDDDEIEKLWNKEHLLQTFLDPSNFKSQEEIYSRLTLVLGFDPLDETLYRPGDVVNSSRKTETAETKMEEQVQSSQSNEEDVPDAFKKSMPSSSVDDDHDFFEDIASRL